MPEPRSRRAKILNGIIRQLKDISVANGYATDVYDVTTRVKVWSDTPEAETPVLYIVDENTIYTYHAGKVTEREWTIGIYGVMKNRDQIEMEEFVADVEECLMKNPALVFDGLPPVISHLRVKDIVTDNQLFSVIDGSQLFKLTINFRYIAEIDNIR